jgi:uncharacterized protein YcaQ
LLHRPTGARDPVEVARRIAGAQAQDVYAGPLTLRSRSRGLTAAAVRRARVEERSLLRSWAMRKTIHLFPAEDADWLLPLFEPATEKWSRRRLGQLGMPARAQERALRAIGRMLEREGPLSRSELAERLLDAGIDLNPQTRLHVMLAAVTSGIACLGPDRGAATCLVLRRDWIGEAKPFDRAAGLAELSRRYLRAFGPATERDFAYWSGLGLGEVRAGLAAIADEMVEWALGDERLYSLRGRPARRAPSGLVRLLGAFDTYLLGYRSREFAVPSSGRAAVKEGGGGWIRPVILVDGRVAGTWRSARKPGGLAVELMPFGRLGRQAREAIAAEVADIGRFEGTSAKLAEF